VGSTPGAGMSKISAKNLKTMKNIIMSYTVVAFASNLTWSRARPLGLYVGY